MVRKYAIIILLVVMCFPTIGCYRTVYLDNGVGRELLITPQKAPASPVIRHFKEEVWNHYFLFALVPTSKPDFREIIQPNVPEGCMVTNLEIRHECTPLNAFIWFLVGGIYNPMTTTIEGDVVKVAH